MMKKQTKEEILENRHQLYVLSCIIGLILLSATFLMTLMILINKPLILIEYKNQSCEYVDTGFGGYWKKIDNNSNLLNFSGLNLSNVDLSDLDGGEVSEDKIPKDYEKQIIYEKICDFSSQYCNYYKREIYIKS